MFSLVGKIFFRNGAYVNIAPWLSVIIYGKIGSRIKSLMLTRSSNRHPRLRNPKIRSCELVACEMDAFQGT